MIIQNKRRGASAWRAGIIIPWCLVCCFVLLLVHISMSSIFELPLKKILGERSCQQESSNNYKKQQGTVEATKYLYNPDEVGTKNQSHEKLEKLRRWGPRTKRNQQLFVNGQISCDRTPSRYDFCSVNGTTIMDPTISTFFVVGPINCSRSPNLIEKIKPYPRKFESFIMTQIKELTITSGPPSPPCQIRHRFPALVFSAGGYTGNFFHDFNDGWIPLFITTNTIFPHRDFVIVVSEAPDWWTKKYKDLLTAFTKHPIITLNDKSTHCFPSANIGLISHGFMTINQTLMTSSTSFINFRSLLAKAYTRNVTLTPKFPKSRPTLVLAIRNGGIGRVIINQNQIIRTMKKIGFNVIIFNPTSDTSLHESYALINSSHAMVGVHGAALTHALFLRPGAVFMQVVPIGVEWASDVFFGSVGRGLNLEYMEYRIGVEESSLVEKYGNSSVLLKDPHSVQVNGKGWPTEIMDIYLKEQNVKLDVRKFREYLKKAYRKAKKFMESEG